MNQEKPGTPDDKDNRFLSLGDLLKTISVATLASAIEQEGIYLKNKYGQWGYANTESKDRALNLIRVYYRWQNTLPQDNPAADPRSPIEVWGSGVDNDYWNFGWVTNLLPNFDSIQREQEALNTEEIDEGGANDADQGTSAKECAVFRAMERLTAEEVSITFVGDKSESGIGANDMLEISARGETRRVPLVALDLVDRRRGRLNSQCAILLGMAHKRKQARTDNKFAKQMTRLRAVFRTHLGIAKPFNKFQKGVGWEPLFKIEDKRGALDERAKLDAERCKTHSLDKMIERNTQFSGADQTHQPFDSENDVADDWLKEHGHF